MAKNNSYDDTDSTNQSLVDDSGNGWNGYIYTGDSNNTQSSNDTTNNTTSTSGSSNTDVNRDADGYDAMLDHSDTMTFGRDAGSGFANLSPYQQYFLNQASANGSSLTSDQLAEMSTKNPEASKNDITGNDGYGHTGLNAAVNVSTDRSRIYGDEGPFMQYAINAQEAGMSVKDIKANLQKAMAQANNQAAYNSLTQANKWDMSASGRANHEDLAGIQGNAKTRSQAMSLANKNLALGIELNTSDKNALKYDSVLRGASPDEINKDLSAIDNAVLGQLRGGNFEAGTLKADKKSTKSSKSTSHTNDKTTDATNSKSNTKALYANSVKVRETIGKNGKPKFTFDVAAKTRADIGGKKAGKYLNSPGEKRSHYQSMSKTDFNKILAANGLQPLSNKQLSQIAKSGKPLANAKDGLAFDAKVTPSKISGRQRISAKSIAPASTKFSYKKEAKLEAKYHPAKTVAPKPKIKATPAPRVSHGRSF